MNRLWIKTWDVPRESQWDMGLLAKYKNPIKYYWNEFFKRSASWTLHFISKRDRLLQSWAFQGKWNESKYPNWCRWGGDRPAPFWACAAASAAAAPPTPTPTPPTPPAPVSCGRRRRSGRTASKNGLSSKNHKQTKKSIIKERGPSKDPHPEMYRVFFFFFTEFDQVLTDYTGVDQLVTACSPQTSKKKTNKKKTAFHHHRTNLHPSIHPSIRHPNASKSILKKKKESHVLPGFPPKKFPHLFFLWGMRMNGKKGGSPSTWNDTKRPTMDGCVAFFFWAENGKKIKKEKKREKKVSGVVGGPRVHDKGGGHTPPHPTNGSLATCPSIENRPKKTQ